MKYWILVCFLCFLHYANGQIINTGGGSSSNADSVTYATNHRLDTAKINIRTEIPTATNDLTNNSGFISGESDGSTTNEGVLSVGAGGSNSATITSNTSGSPDVVIQGGSGIAVTESTDTVIITATGGGGGGLNYDASTNRIAFWGNADSLISDDNLYWDRTNSRLGIGTTSPSRVGQIGIFSTNSGNNDFMIAGYNSAKLEFGIHGGWSLPTLEANLDGDLILSNQGSNKTTINVQFGSSSSRLGKMEFYYDDKDAITFGTHSALRIGEFGIEEVTGSYIGNLTFKSRFGTGSTDQHEFKFLHTGNMLLPGTVEMPSPASVDSDISGHLMGLSSVTDEFIPMTFNTARNLYSSTPWIDGSTTGWYPGQLHFNSTSGILTAVKQQSDDPDSGATGSKGERVFLNKLDAKDHTNAGDTLKTNALTYVESDGDGVGNLTFNIAETLDEGTYRIILGEHNDGDTVFISPLSGTMEDEYGNTLTSLPISKKGANISISKGVDGNWNVIGKYFEDIEQSLSVMAGSAGDNPVVTGSFAVTEDIGKYVEMAGYIEMDDTAVATYTLDITPPISATFESVSDVNGNYNLTYSDGTLGSCDISAETSSNKIRFECEPSTTASVTEKLSFVIKYKK